MSSILDGKNLDDKLQLFRLVEEELRSEHQKIIRSAKAAHEGATHEDAVAKSKYDTHGLELSYLAGSQYERARRLELELAEWKRLVAELDCSSEQIREGSLVELARHNSQVKKLVLLSPYGAGIHVSWQQSEVLVLSPDSPLGMELMECEVGDEISTKKDTQSEWAILAVL